MTSSTRADGFYALYQGGLSLSEVGEMAGVTRQSIYGLFKTRGWPCRPRKTLPFVIFNGNKYTLRNNGYYGNTYGNRSLLHRDMWEHTNGPIPPNYDIHHKDHDKTNNVLSNFELLSKSDHARIYSTGCNQSGHKCGNSR